MVEIGGKSALIYATDAVMRLMFGFGIRVVYNVYAMSSGGFGTTHYQNTTNDNRKDRI